MSPADAIRQQFQSQTALATLGAQLARVEPGLVEVGLPRHHHLLQQNGYLHGGITATLGDTACGFAALSLAPPGSGVLTVEFKINFLSPAAGHSFLARGRVKKAGRTLTVCEGDVLALRDGEEPKTVATLLATIMIINR